MKKLFLSFIVTLTFVPTVIAVNSARIEPRDEKIVTNKWSALVGSASVANHYLSDYEYTGVLFGIKAEHGAFYKRSENLSWSLDLSFLSTLSYKTAYESALSNPAESNYWVLKNGIVQYGTSYNWNPAKNFYLRAGGVMEFLIGNNTCQPNNINNSSEYDGQIQLKASGGIKYGWHYEKFSFFLYGDLEIPVLGTTLASSRYNSSASTIFNDITKTENKIIKMTSLHNLSGFNAEIGADFSFKKWSLFVSTEMNNRWWNLYDVQNYRKFTFFKIGVGVDLVSRPHVKYNARYF